MRTALLAVAAVAAAGLVVPMTVTAAGAADPQPAGTQYRDPAQSQAASVSVTGTLTPIHSEVGEEHAYAVSLPNGAFIPVSLGEQDIDEPRSFTGDIAISDDLAETLDDRGVTVADGEDISGSTAEGRTVVAAASASTEALPVQSATIGTAPTQSSRTVQATATPSTHRLYVAVINNRGALESDSVISAKLAQMRSYWTTESDGLISSFDQPTATVSYASTVAASADAGCGLAGPTPVWDEAAGKFPGVNFSAAGNHLMVLVPDACGANGAAGIGTVGGSLRSGGRTIVTLGSTAVAIGVHELGHNLSLAHANAEKCTSTCSTSEYWDLYSIMGLAVGGSTVFAPAALDTSYRLLLGIDDATSIPTITSTTTVHLAGRATTSGTRGFVVTDPSSGAKYSVEYRSGSGRDAQAFYATSRNFNGYTFRPGVVIERMESGGSTTMITRPSGSTYLTSFVANDTFSRGSLTISVTAAAASTGADVAVTVAGTTPSTTPTTPSTTPTSTPPTTTPPTATPPAVFVPGVPSVLGTPRVGQRLAVGTTRWLPTPDRYAFQWLADGQPMAGATGASLLLSQSTYGQRISVVLTGLRTGYVSVARTSAATRAVAAGRFNSRDLRITGRAKVGRTLSVATGDWRPSPSFSYRWYANGKPLAKATGRTLKVTKSLRGKRITVRVTARQYAYEPASRSAATSRVR